MSNSNAVSNVLGSFGGQLGLVNTGMGMGMKNVDGKFSSLRLSLFIKI